MATRGHAAPPLGSRSLPTRPWWRPEFGCTLCHGDPGSAAPPMRTPHPSCTRLGRLRARLPTTAAHHNATLSGGAAPPRDVPRPSHRGRSYGLRCAVLTDSFGYGVRTAATRAQSPGSRLIPAFLTTGTAFSIYNGKTDLPLENVSTIGMDSSWAGSAVSGLSPRITRSACFPTVIEPFVSSSKY